MSRVKGEGEDTRRGRDADADGDLNVLARFLGLGLEKAGGGETDQVPDGYLPALPSSLWRVIVVDGIVRSGSLIVLTRVLGKCN